jgi:hypothetical protein
VSSGKRQVRLSVCVLREPQSAVKSLAYVCDYKLNEAAH